MELMNFDDCKRPDISMQNHYGGASGNKEHVLIDNENYFIKYPNRLGNVYSNINLSYSNSPLCEYIGSHIYEILGFNVHKTILGISEKRGHVLVACKDFLKNGDRLDEFKNIKVSYAPTFDDNEDTSGNGCNLDNVLEIIQNNNFLKSIPQVEEHFWDMFVVDALIGNTDRNNGNWGIVRHVNGINEISPVYDNGNSFNNKWDDEKFKVFINDSTRFKNEAYTGKLCIFTKTDNNANEKNLNPFKIIASQKYDKLNKSICKIVPLIYQNNDEIINLINEIPNEWKDIKIISDTQKKFYRDILRLRYNDIFRVVHNNILNPTNKIDINFKNMIENKDRNKADYE